MIRTVISKDLSDDAKMIREEVFVKEQKFKKEFDETDGISEHLVIYEDELPIACCRFYKKNMSEYVVGRIAVLKSCRGKHIGEKLMRDVEDAVIKRGGTRLSLSAQLRVSEFYKKQGFVPTGNTYFDEYCEHIKMEKNLI